MAKVKLLGLDFDEMLEGRRGILSVCEVVRGREGEGGQRRRTELLHLDDGIRALRSLDHLHTIQ
jgi:hypothetical protein